MGKHEIFFITLPLIIIFSVCFFSISFYFMYTHKLLISEIAFLNKQNYKLHAKIKSCERKKTKILYEALTKGNEQK